MTKKRTKVIATISSNNCSKESIDSLYKAGMNIVRINTAHTTFEGAQFIIDCVREVSSDIGILLDTKGPEIRTNTLEEKNRVVAKDDFIKIFVDEKKVDEKNAISMNYLDFLNHIKLGDELLIDDGTVELQICEINKEKAFVGCKALNNGVIGSRKTVNVPCRRFPLPSLTDRDIEFIHFAIEQDIDFIAHSFVRYKEDVISIKEILNEKKSDIKIIAKIENQEGVDNLQEIIDHVYGIMIARGDLGVEISHIKIPVIQDQIINECRQQRKAVIIATQMLHSMIGAPRPTRAEVTDVAHAIQHGADAIMLSGETAYGKYPIESVSTMTNIALEIEKGISSFRDLEPKVLSTEISAHLTRHAVLSSDKLGSKAIISDSVSGRTVRNIAAYRGHKPVYALCYNKKTVRELSLIYGVYAYHVPFEGDTSYRNIHTQFIYRGISLLLEKGLIAEDDQVILVAGNYGKGRGATFIEISTADRFVKS